MSRVRRFRVRPPVLAVAVTAIYGTVNVAVPVALSSLARRYGWHASRPDLANLAGVVPLVGGLIILVRAGRGHVDAWRRLDWRVVKVDPDHLLTPDYLVTDGLYRFSRNPLYVGDIAMWTGWTLLLGSLPVLVGLVVLVVGLQVGVRLEEQGLARQFGADWVAYARATPRFIGRGMLRPHR